MNKEKLKELLKDKFEECSEEEAYDKETNYLKKGYLGIYSDSDVKEIFFKPVQKFPIVFEGSYFNLEIDENLHILCDTCGDKFELTEDNLKKDIEANKKALEELERLNKQ